MYLYIFGYAPGLYIVSSPIWVIFRLLWIREGSGIHCKFITNLIESTWARILFPAQYRTGMQNQIRNTGWRSISKYHRVSWKQASLYLGSFIVTASLVFSPRVFSRPYHAISQTLSPQIMCWTHWFHHVYICSLHPSRIHGIRWQSIRIWWLFCNIIYTYPGRPKSCFYIWTGKRQKFVDFWWGKFPFLILTLRFVPTKMI